MRRSREFLQAVKSAKVRFYAEMMRAVGRRNARLGTLPPKIEPTEVEYTCTCGATVQGRAALRAHRRLHNAPPYQGRLLNPLMFSDRQEMT